MSDYPQYRTCSCSQWTNHANSCPQNPKVIRSVKRAAQILRAKPPTLHREEANLSQKDLNVPQVNPQCDKPKET
jgi:hypothetical protein